MNSRIEPVRYNFGDPEGKKAPMLLLNGLKSLQKVLWQSLRPGWIVVGGVQINGSLPPELLDYPVLTPELIQALHNKYHLFNNRAILAAEADYASGYNPSQELFQAKERSIVMNKIRAEVFSEKNELLNKFGLELQPDSPLMESGAAEVQFLHRDRYNSMDIVYDGNVEDIPSALHHKNASVAFADLLTGSLYSKLQFPFFKPFTLHIGVDYSHSMTNYNKLDFVLKAANDLHRFVNTLYPQIQINLLPFSDACERAVHPLQGREVPKKETSYDALFRKVLKYWNNDTCNKLILLTDGLPSDREAALERAEVLKKKRLDFTQIIFSANDEERNIVEGGGPTLDGYSLVANAPHKRLNDDEFAAKREKLYNGYSEMADALNGNQIIVKIYDFLKLISIEAFDRYTGYMSVKNKI